MTERFKSVLGNVDSYLRNGTVGEQWLHEGDSTRVQSGISTKAMIDVLRFQFFGWIDSAIARGSASSFVRSNERKVLTLVVHFHFRIYFQ